ncbi:MAG: type VI secretion system tube protein Hcp [Hyphomonadaceae bacterium]|nr:type VI secretion system tube protein Hcp [Hyphomonadaceae bacterium]
MSIRTFARTSILSAIALAGAGAANADVFLKVDGAPGEATLRGFEGQISVSGASMNVSSFTMPDPEGLTDQIRSTTVGPIFITKLQDRSSPKLMMAAVEGQPLGRIEVTFTSPLRAGGQAVDSKWILEGAEVRSYNVNPDFNNGNMPTESIEISYSSMKYQYYGKDAKGQRTGTMEEVTWRVPDQQLFPFDEGCR